jgi:hypothetical protein
MRLVTSVVGGAVLLALAVIAAGSDARAWPPFLPGQEAYAPPVAEAVRRLWLDATFTRSVRGEPAPVPLSFYLRFIDVPDVAAAAARHLGLTTYEVRPLGGDWYAVDGGGAQGVYRVLERDGGRRVLLSWGTHRGSILGAVGGSALTRLEFADDRGRAAQQLAVNAIIDNGLVAGLARPALVLFGWFVDRKLNEAFRTAAAAAAWAHARPDAFCAWLSDAVTEARRAEVLPVFEECGGTATSRRGR